MNEKSIATIIGILGCAGIALLVYITMPGEPPPAAAPTPAEHHAETARPNSGLATASSKTPSAASPCTIERLNSWRLVSVGIGGYRQPGFAVLYNDRFGALNVTETGSFDGNLHLKRVSQEAVDLSCDELIVTRRLSEGGNAPDGMALPQMKTILPEPRTTADALPQ